MNQNSNTHQNLSFRFLWRLLLLIGFFGIVAAPVQAATWYVNDADTTGDFFTTSPGTDAWTDAEAEDNPDSPFLTIGRALVATSPGDTVAIDSGIFNENVSFDTNGLMLRGASSDSSIIDGRIVKNGGSGLVIRDLGVINSASVGIALSNMDTPLISGVRVFSSSDQGIRLNTVSGALVENTVSTGAGAQGMRFDNTTGSTITQSTVGQSNDEGILLDNSSNNTLTDNTLINNGQGFPKSGLIISTSDNNRIRNNISRSNTEHGFEEDNSSGNLYRANESDSNSQDGFNLSGGGSNPTLKFNLIKNNGRFGFHADDVTGIKLILNEIRGNLEYQLSFDNPIGFTNQTKNNIQPSGTNSDSLVINQTGGSITLERNWWNTTDSGVIDTGTVGSNVDFIPFRLATVDTSPGADTVAPSVPNNVTVDTAFPERVGLTWQDNTTQEEPGIDDPGFDASGRRIYRTQDKNLTDWKNNATLLTDQLPSDTDFVDTTVNTDTTYFYRFTSYDGPDGGNDFENESYFSQVFEVDVPAIGPGIYVNDTSTVGDVFTSDTGNDSNVGIPQFPVRTIGQALELATPGDTIFIDAGTYGETLAFDTMNLSVIGAGQELTHVTGAGNSEPVWHATGGATNWRMRSLTVRNHDGDGIHLDGATDGRLTNLTLRNNNGHGLNFTNGADNHYVAQVTFDSNAGFQVNFDGSTSNNNVIYSNLFADTFVGFNGVGDTPGGNNLNHNWWLSTDSSVIQSQTTGTPDYIPFRFGKVDTGVGADSVAPAPPAVAIDTGTPGELTLSWNGVNQDEDGSTLSGLSGYRIFRIEGTGDTDNWLPNQVKTLAPGDTEWIDTGIEKAQPYSYRVTAFDGQTPENSSYFSSTVSGTWFNRVPLADTIAKTTQVDSAIGVTLTGSDPDGDTINFSIADGPTDGTLSGTAPDIVYSPDPGFTGADSFTFRITDGVDTSAPGTVTIDVATLLQIEVDKIQTDALELPAIANGTDTVAVTIRMENLGTANGTVLRDTDQLRIRNGLGEDVTDSFTVTMTDTDLFIPQGQSRDTQWIIHLPNSPTSSSDTKRDFLGNFQVHLDPDRVDIRDEVSLDVQSLPNTETNRQRRTFNIMNSPFEASANQFSIFSQSMGLQFGTTLGSDVFDLSGLSANPGDSIFVISQRGHMDFRNGNDVNTLDSPIVGPTYSFSSLDDFEDTVADADNAYLQNTSQPGEKEIIDTGLFTVSAWLGSVGDTYIADVSRLDEDVDVQIDNISFSGDPNRLRVVKLVKENNAWVWREIADFSQDGNVQELSSDRFRLTFTVSSSNADGYAGFSVFRIVAGGFSPTGQASDAVVYPNPFVPTDNDPSTGEYGNSGDDGIHFGAGSNQGFPTGTSVKIYTIRGEEVAGIKTNSGGVIIWDAHTQNGEPAASGIYLYRIEVPGGGSKTGKFAIVR